MVLGVLWALVSAQARCKGSGFRPLPTPFFFVSCHILQVSGVEPSLQGLILSILERTLHAKICTEQILKPQTEVQNDADYPGFIMFSFSVLPCDKPHFFFHKISYHLENSVKKKDIFYISIIIPRNKNNPKQQ